MERLLIHNKMELALFALGDELSDGICLCDRNGVILAVNKEYNRIIGVSSEEIVGKHVSYFKDNGYIDYSIQAMVLQEKKKINKMLNLKKNNNLAMITSIPIFDGNNEVDQVLSVIRDLTEISNLKSRLEKSEKKSKKYLRELNNIRSILKKNDGFIGESLSVKKLKELVKSIAKTDATILITGETGCGKEVLAREIYINSERNNKPYIKINCAAIPESLIESELFGYEQGAFTGAQNKGKMGMFEAANGGTLLLDEIGEMPLPLQSKLLRVLQEKELMRIGGTKSIKLDVRVIAATNQNLIELVQRKEFRQDLYYRLNVIPIRIPSLRERKEDIVLLAHSFLNKYNLKYGKNLLLDNRILNVLEEYNWPGNVRELENVIERLVVVSVNDDIDINYIMDILGYHEKDIAIDYDQLTLKEAVESVEKKMIKRALSQCGSTYKAAEVLGMNQSSIFRKAKAYGLLSQ